MAKNRNLTPVPPKLDAAEMLTSVITSPEYTRNLEDGHPTQRALARAALELAGMEHDTEIEETYEPHSKEIRRDTYRHALIGTLPAFVHGAEAVDHYHKNPGAIDQQSYRSLKRHTARFNHVVKAMIERDPELSFDNISSTVVDLYGVLNRGRWRDDREGYEAAARDFKKLLEGALRGMQQEVIARQVIEAINSLDKSPSQVFVDSDVTVEDDMKGVDLYVTLDGVTFPVDIKASERTAQNARSKVVAMAAKAQKRGRAWLASPNAILTSGIPSPALNGAFSVSDERARQNAPRMLKKLYAARAEYMELHGITEESLTRSRSEVALAA